MKKRNLMYTYFCLGLFVSSFIIAFALPFPKYSSFYRVISFGSAGGISTIYHLHKNQILVSEGVGLLFYHPIFHFLGYGKPIGSRLPFLSLNHLHNCSSFHVAISICNYDCSVYCWWNLYHLYESLYLT